jgi:uncharacterized membrane protein (DUF485 family)
MATDTPAPPVPPEEGRSVAVQQSPEFVALRKAYRGFVFPTTVAFLVWYGLYVVLSAYARSFMSHKLFGNINVALVFGLLQFVSTFLLAWAYTRHADRRLDPLADRLRRQLEGTERIEGSA